MKLNPSILALAAASLGVAQLQAVDLFWDADAAGLATGGTGSWDTSSVLWHNGSYVGPLQAWLATGGNNDAFLGGSAGTLTLTTAISVNDITVSPSPSGTYIIAGAQTLTLNGIAQSVIDVASGSTLAITSGLAGTNGFTKNNAGTVILDGAAGTNGLIGGITVNGGILQAGSAANNSASQVLRSNAVNLGAGTSLTTVGTTIDLRVGSLGGSGSVTPATGGAINELVLADSTFSGTITTTGGLNLRGGNGTTQTFNGNLTALTAIYGINSGVTIKLTGNGDNTSGVAGATSISTRGGSFVMDNTGGNTSAAAGRLSNTTTLSAVGGTFSLIGNSAGSSETVGSVTFNDGALTVSVTNNGGTGAQLTFTDSGSLRDSTKMTVNFVGAGTGTLGVSGNNPRITFTSLFTGTGTGLLANTSGSDTTIGWATVNGTEWAGYGANGIVAVASSLTASANTTLQTATATSVTLFNPSANQTLTGGVATATLKIAPTNSALSLEIGSNNLNAIGLMLAGTNDFTINRASGTGTVLSGGTTRYVYVSDANTVLTLNNAPLANGQPLTKSGAGTLFLSGSTNLLPFTSNQNVNLVQGTLRGTPAALGGGISAGGAFTTLNLRGAVIEISGGGTFNRAFNQNGAAGGGGINWDGGSGTTRGDGGFSAIGGNSSVTLMTTVGGSTAAPLLWNATGFLANGYVLTMGTTKADSRIDFTNNIGLDDGTAANSYFAREIRVAENISSSTDLSRLSGIISGSTNADLLKTGAGVLELTGTNTYDGNTLVQQGTLLVNGNQSAANGIVSVASGATLGGSGTVGGNVSINNGAIVAPGNSPGILTVAGTSTLDIGSIFSWELNSDVDHDGVATDGTRGSNYDGLTSTNLAVASGAIFRVVLTGAADIGSTFWDQTQVWNNVFSVSGSTAEAAAGQLFNAFEVYNGNTNVTLASASEGSFSFNGSTLTWSAVPEPTSALAGFLLGAGLLRRRRGV